MAGEELGSFPGSDLVHRFGRGKADCLLSAEATPEIPEPGTTHPRLLAVDASQRQNRRNRSYLEPVAGPSCAVETPRAGHCLSRPTSFRFQARCWLRFRGKKKPARRSHSSERAKRTGEPRTKAVFSAGETSAGASAKKAGIRAGVNGKFHPPH